MDLVGFADSHYDSFTGAQQAMLPLLRDATSYESILLAPKRGKCVNQFESAGIETRVIQYPQRLDRFGSALTEAGVLDKTLTGGALCQYYLTVLRELRESGIDLLYCNDVRSVFLFGPPAKLLGLPVVWYVHIDVRYPRFDEIAYRLVDKAVSVSDGVRERFEPTKIGHSDDEFRTIYIGVDVNEFNPDAAGDVSFEFNENESINIVQVAKIHPRKRQKNLLEAVGRVSNDLPEYNVIFAGPTADGYEEYAQSLRETAKKEGIDENVVFLGWCDELVALLSAADLFVLPSSNEGFPRSILEAYSMGLPVITTPAGGTAELVDDERTGVLVPIDDVEALSEALGRLCYETETREAFGRNARELVIQEFRQERYVAEFEAFTKELLSK